jgi:tetratricopeptide (TPR) repeat protein
MRRIAGAVGWIVVAALTMGRASAQSPSAELADKYARGEYLEVADAAEAAAGANDLAFAARALLAHCLTGPDEPDVAIIDRASKDAEAALKIDPVHDEGRLQLAIALSLKSRGMDAMDALNRGYGEKGRELASEVLQSNPGNYYAHGFLAVWNVEVRRRGGSIGAAFMGASLKDGRRHYDEAIRLAPNDIGIHWQYGRALVALSARDHGDEAARILARATSSDARDHVEQVMQERARTLSDVLRNDRKAAQKLARKML